MPRPKCPKWLTWPRVENALLLAVIAFALYRFAPQLGAIAGVGDPIGSAPAVTFTSLDGEALTMADLEGRVVEGPSQHGVVAEPYQRRVGERDPADRQGALRRQAQDRGPAEDPAAVVQQRAGQLLQVVGSTEGLHDRLCRPS